MPRIPDLSDSRYLDEVGWFLYHERHGRDQYGGSYDDERRAYSRMFLGDVVECLGWTVDWFEDKTVVSIGCGCTGDLTAFPAPIKIAIDPLLFVYQRLGMLVKDEVGGRTVYISVDAQDVPLLDGQADLIVCRNALDHMPNPKAALAEMRRILRADGYLFVSVDIGGVPTPDEPSVFTRASLRDLVARDFEIVKFDDAYPPHSVGRECSVRVGARKAAHESATMDKEAILRAYEARLP
jgi:SAM-dependent methyltransferase